jgi:hypothetical protein
VRNAIDRVEDVDEGLVARTPAAVVEGVFPAAVRAGRASHRQAAHLIGGDLVRKLDRVV